MRLTPRARSVRPDFIGRRGAWLTVGLLVLQLGGCALDTLSKQVALLSMFCTAAPDDEPLVLVSGAVWIVLAFSWIVGLLALVQERLRPIYWALVAAIPLAAGAQFWLLQRNFLYCDAP